MKYSKLILLFSITLIVAGLLLTACDNRIVDPLNYIIASMTTDENVIFSDGDETTFATIKVMIKDSDDFAVFGQAVQFRTDMGYLTPAEAVTDSSGIATVQFHDGNAFGYATIEAIVGNISETIEIYIDGVPPQDVSSIGFDISEQIQISVQGTGGTETFELVASLYDSSGQLINQPKTVWFELLYAPEGTNINNVGLIDSTTSIAGKASVNINSGEHSGIVTCKVFTYTLEGGIISSTKSNIVVASGLTHTVEFAIAGHSSGLDMGSGMWKVQISALLNDIEGNPVAAGTAVYFSLPDEPEWASVVAASYVNNLNAQGDSLAGVAYSYLTYDGSHTNDVVNVRIETGLGDIFEGELILPLQFPIIDIAAVPLHIDWWQIPYPSPEYQSTEIRITVMDGQNNPIDNQIVVFSTTLGEPLEPYPPDTGDPYTGLTGVINGEHGRLNKEVEFYYQECPPPGTAPPGTTTGSITAQILGTQTSNQVTIILRRYID
ncbi:MAG: Ig-like domain-containing protein [Candidatus Cloacimonadota bacterium]|nr:Ig-like domain-containing protein [Candidatus Cloacimonadota bacterium]